MTCHLSRRLEKLEQAAEPDDFTWEEFVDRVHKLNTGKPVDESPEFYHRFDASVLGKYMNDLADRITQQENERAKS